MFSSAGENAWPEIEDRKKIGGRLLKFGIQFLDDALAGIFPDDLILVGAPSGVGKTQLCCNFALTNMKQGHKVHYIALESPKYEIERRLKYPMVMSRYWDDPYRKELGRISFTDWLIGKHASDLKDYEADVACEFEMKYKDLFLYHKGDKFGLSELIESVMHVSDETSLIIVDHVHYFDLDDDNENRAIKKIAKTVRDLVIEEKKPIMLVAHLRKKERGSDDLIPSLEDFHGSSDLYKIATRVITMAPGDRTLGGLYQTFFRIPKNRLDSGVTRYSAVELFDPRSGGYIHGKYELGKADQSRSDGFQIISSSEYPDWGTKQEGAGCGDFDRPDPRGRPWHAKIKTGQGTLPNLFKPD